MLEPGGMDHEQRSTPLSPIRDRGTMTSSSTSGSARQLARNKGLAWVSAITLGAGAATALGGAAIVVTLASTTTATGSTAAVTAAGTSTQTSSGSQLQAAAAPTTTSIPPVATTGAS